MGEIKRPDFRQYHECQNGHPRFLYWKHKTGFENEAWWGSKHPECNCKTAGFGEGFSAKYTPDMCLPVKGDSDQLLFEGDVYINDEGFEKEISLQEYRDVDEFGCMANYWGFQLIEQEFDEINVVDTKYGWLEPTE